MFGANQQKVACLLVWVFFASIAGLSPALAQHENSSDLQSLFESQGEFRHWRGRLSEYPYRAYRSQADVAQLSLEALRQEAFRARLRAENRLMLQAELDPVPESIAERGIVELMRGQFDSSIRDLEAALLHEPENARLLNDLAVAYHARAMHQERYYDLVAALSTVEEALLADPEMQEAAFNRAILQQELFLKDSALENCRRYLQRDSESGWAGECRALVESVSLSRQSGQGWESLAGAAADPADSRILQRSVEESPYRAWRYLRELLREWANLAPDKPDEAAQRLEAAWRVAELLYALNQDALLWESINRIRRLQASGGEAFQDLLQGHRTYEEALRVNDSGEKVRLLGEAERLLSDAKSPFHLWARVERALHYVNSDFEELLNILQDEEGLPLAGGSEYYALQARVEWLIGLAKLRQQKLAESFSHYQKAIRLYERAGHREQVANMYDKLADNMLLLGDPITGWSYQFTALKGVHATVDEERRYAIMLHSSISARRVGQLLAAQNFGLQALRYARTAEQVVNANLIGAYIECARVHWLLSERYPGRIQYLNAAMDFSRDAEQALAPPGQQLDSDGRNRAPRTWSEAEIRLIQALISPDIDAAKEHSEMALGYFREENHLIKTAQARRALAGALVKQRNHSEATLQLEANIRESEESHGEIEKAKDRISHFGPLSELYGVILGHLSESDAHIDKAFELLERKRARASNLYKKRNPHPAALAEIKAQLPQGYSIVQYAVLEDRLLIWAFSGGRVHWKRVSISEKALKESVERLAAGLESADNQQLSAGAAETLYGLLIDPISGLELGELIVFVPDGFLTRIPFSVLRNPESGRYLMQDHAVAVALSSSDALRALQSPRFGKLDGLRTLCVANPHFDRELFPHLEDLPGALDEIEGLRESLDVLLTEDAATKDRFLSHLPESNALIYAGHSVSMENGSTLLLSPSGDDRGLMDSLAFAEKADLSGLQLAVLSACRTGRSNVDGVLGFAQVLLEKGVPHVLASLSPIDDQANASLLKGFYSNLEDGKSIFQAFRTAQASMLDGPAGPSAWAGMQLFISTP